MNEPIGIYGVGVWSPTIASAAAWAERAFRDPESRPSPALIPPRQVRRASLMSRMAAAALEDCVATSSTEVASARLVFASMLGEVDAAASLIEMMTRSSLLSPLRFQNSVHNTSAGLLSIATGNRGFSTTISAGWELVAMGLLESAALIDQSDEPVLLVVQEETWPAFLGAQNFDPLCVALALGRPGGAGELARLGPTRPAPRAALWRGRGDTPEQLVSSPVLPALWLLDAVGDGSARMLQLHADVETPTTAWSASFESAS